MFTNFLKLDIIFYKEVNEMKKVTDIYKVDEDKLAHSFQDACSDKEFYDYVYGLNVKEEVLMKYTSSLEDAFLAL